MSGIVVASSAVEQEKQAWRRPVVSCCSIAEITMGGAGSICDNANTIGLQNNACLNSDIRLKRDIYVVGATPDGLKLYSFRYNGDEETFVGVMAQDVLEVMPEAVVTRADGFYAVDYAMLGLEMISLDKWRAGKAVH
jgi:hypothetical protein